MRVFEFKTNESLNLGGITKEVTLKEAKDNETRNISYNGCGCDIKEEKGIYPFVSPVPMDVSFGYVVAKDKNEAEKMLQLYYYD